VYRRNLTDDSVWDLETSLSHKPSRYAVFGKGSAVGNDKIVIPVHRASGYFTHLYCYNKTMDATWTLQSILLLDQVGVRVRWRQVSKVSISGNNMLVPITYYTYQQIQYSEIWMFSVSGDPASWAHTATLVSPVPKSYPIVASDLCDEYAAVVCEKYDRDKRQRSYVLSMYTIHNNSNKEPSSVLWITEGIRVAKNGVRIHMNTTVVSAYDITGSFILIYGLNSSSGQWEEETLLRPATPSATLYTVRYNSYGYISASPI
jgi:hypothetical protein